jgi:hypothetical protein
MTSSKKLGIWMDHSTAHIMEYSGDPIESKTIESKRKDSDKDQEIIKDESTLHHNEQHDQAEFYKQLSHIIVKFDEVLVFGPTDAKVELFNLLKADHHFDKVKMEIQSADKMTVGKQHAFVRDYFSKG